MNSTDEWVSSRDMAIALGLHVKSFYFKMSRSKDRLIEGYHIKTITPRKYLWHKQQTILLVNRLNQRKQTPDINNRYFSDAVGKPRLTDSSVVCPNCGSNKVSVLETTIKGDARFRKRACSECTLRFMSVETISGFLKPKSSLVHPEEFNSELLDRLKCEETRRDAITQVHEKLGVKWNDAIAYLDKHYRGWRGYEVQYVDGTKG